MFTLELFPLLSRELLSVLRRLSPREWEHPTACAPWSVKDVAAHLLGGNLGRLSSGRDGHSGAGGAASYQDLLRFIDESNAEWVRAAKRISPRLLIGFLEQTDEQLYHYFKTLAPDDDAAIPVSWAGDLRSPVWFDIAREYTEKWLHQQHIREAAGQPPLTSRRFLFPVLDTFLRALPHTYRIVQAEENTTLTFCITGEPGGEWSLLRRDGAWLLFSGSAPAPLSRVTLDQDLAWRLFTRGIRREKAGLYLHIDGEQAPGLAILNMVSIMA